MDTDVNNYNFASIVITNFGNFLLECMDFVGRNYMWITSES